MSKYIDTSDYQSEVCDISWEDIYNWNRMLFWCVKNGIEMTVGPSAKGYPFYKLRFRHNDNYFDLDSTDIEDMIKYCWDNRMKIFALKMENPPTMRKISLDRSALKSFAAMDDYDR